MTGYLRMIYGILGWTYVSKNEHCPWQKHLKYLCCEELKRTNAQNMLTRISARRRYYLINYKTSS